MTLIPVANRILVKPDLQPTETKTDIGIIIASTVRETQIKGTVIAIGEDVHLVKAGDVIYYTKHAGTEIKASNEAQIVMNQEDVLAIIKDEGC